PAVDLRPPQGQHHPGAALTSRQPGYERGLVHQSQDQGDHHLHRLRPERRPLLQALRPRRQFVRDTPEGDAGPARELARPPGAGRAALTSQVPPGETKANQPTEAPKEPKPSSPRGHALGHDKAFQRTASPERAVTEARPPPPGSDPRLGSGSGGRV